MASSSDVLLEMDDEVLLEKVDEVARGPILEYCTFYRGPGYSEMEEKRFLKQFFRKNSEILPELIAGGKCMVLEQLVVQADAALSDQLLESQSRVVNVTKEERLHDRSKNIEVEEPHVDERSVDDLMSFINGEEKDSKGAKSKKNRHKKKPAKACSEFLDRTEDPTTKEILDREIESFARRLEVDWLEKREEILNDRFTLSSIWLVK